MKPKRSKKLDNPILGEIEFKCPNEKCLGRIPLEPIDDPKYTAVAMCDHCDSMITYTYIIKIGGDHWLPKGKISSFTIGTDSLNKRTTPHKADKKKLRKP